MLEIQRNIKEFQRNLFYIVHYKNKYDIIRCAWVYAAREF